MRWSAELPQGIHDFGYDSNGNRITFSDDGIPSTLTYEPSTNRLSAITGAEIVNYGYDAVGNTLNIDQVGVFERDFEYDPRGRARFLRLNGDTQPVAEYKYNGLGQRVEKQLVNGTLRRYWYGLNGELLAESDGNGNIGTEYVYLNGELITIFIGDRDGDGVSDAVDNCQDRPNPDQRNTNVNPSDPFGNLCDPDFDDDLDVDQDDADHLQAMLGTNDADTDLNGDGIVDNVDALILASLWQQPPGPAGSSTSQDPGVTKYVHTDHLGTPQFLTDESGGVVWQATYEPFGLATVNQDVDGDGIDIHLNVRFPGQYYDQESGLHYNYHRSYDPVTGRYITSDPIGLEGGLNTYLYANANPLTYTDPTGEIAFIPILVGAAVGLAFDYALEQYKESKCTCSDTPAGPVGNAALGASFGFFGPFDKKPRTGIAGGGPSGGATSTFSQLNHAASRRGLYSTRTRNLLTTVGRRVPYVSTAIIGYEVFDAATCD